MRLIVFNPWHEEALARPAAPFAPSRAARLQEQLYPTADSLPWARPGDVLWRPGQKVNWAEVDAIEPWGWDAWLCILLRRAGAPAALLPTEAELVALRRLSSRKLAVSVLTELHDARFFGASAWVDSLSGALAAARRFGGTDFVLKSPYSCAGRGLVFVRLEQDAAGRPRLGTEAQQLRLGHLLALQGALVVEPRYPHDADLALEFRYDGGVLACTGLNVFRTNAAGQYRGNVSDAHIPPAARALVRLAGEQLARILPRHLGADYRGPLGVDMMLADHRLHPCVEINLRHTMGQGANS